MDRLESMLKDVRRKSGGVVQTQQPRQTQQIQRPPAQSQQQTQSVKRDSFSGDPLAALLGELRNNNGQQ